MFMTLGERICEQRTARSLSQTDLADALEVSRQSVSKWETDASVPELDKLVKICELFGVSMDALVRGEESPQEEGGQTVYIQAKSPLTVRTVIGLMLVFFGLVIFSAALLFVRASLDSCLFYSVPFLLCGALCLRCKKHPVLACCWGLWGLMTLLLFPFARWYPSHPTVRWFAAADLLLAALLICVTAWIHKQSRT